MHGVLRGPVVLVISLESVANAESQTPPRATESESALKNIP